MHHSSISWEVSLLYFFSWNFIWFLQKDRTKEQNFRLSTAQVKFHILLLKVYKVSAKEVWRSYFSWYQQVAQNLKKNFFFVSKMTSIWWILIRALKSLKNLHFDWSILCKVYSVWLKKVQRSYISWHWRVMQNLKVKWLAVSKMTWGIWQIFTRPHEILKVGTFIGSFYTT